MEPNFDLKQDVISDTKPFLEHFYELRSRIIVTIFFFLCFFLLSYPSAPAILEMVKSSATNYGIFLNIFKVAEPVMIYVKIMLLEAVSLTLPVIVIQIYLFVAPALENRTKKLALLSIPIVSLLFIIGIYIGITFFVPALMLFFIKVANSINIDLLFGFSDYFSFVIKICVFTGVILELPALLGFLSLLGIVTSVTLQRIRRFVYPILCFVAVIMTPPDFLSASVLMILLFLLYEISIITCIFLSNIKKRIVKGG